MNCGIEVDSMGSLLNRAVQFIFVFIIICGLNSGKFLDSAINYTGSNVIKRSKSVCPHGFTFLQEAKKCYRLETDRLEWEVARMRCKRLSPKAHPVVIEDHKENRAIAAYITYRYDLISRHCLSDKWIAIWTAGQRVDPNKKSTFVWKPEPYPSSWSEMSYTAWERGQPSYHANQESCMQLRVLSEGNILWNDAPCGIHTVPGMDPKAGFMCVLCEIDME